MSIKQTNKTVKAATGGAILGTAISGLFVGALIGAAAAAILTSVSKDNNSKNDDDKIEKSLYKEEI